MNRQQRRQAERQSKKQSLDILDQNIIQEIVIEAFDKDFKNDNKELPLLTKMIQSWKEKKGMDSFFDSITDDELNVYIDSISQSQEAPEYIILNNLKWDIMTDLTACALHLVAFRTNKRKLKISTDNIEMIQTEFQFFLSSLFFFRKGIIKTFKVPKQWEKDIDLNLTDEEGLEAKNFFENNRQKIS